jgi:hypothetical protein
MSHHCIDWIPSDLANQVCLFWTLDFDKPDYAMPLVWVEHGIPDNHVIEKKQFHEDVHYLCSNEWTFKRLSEEGLKAHHVGHIFIDKTIPQRRNPHLLVYAPQHCRFEHHKLPTEWNHDPLTKEELEELCREHDCDGYVTSIIDDTQRDLYEDLNPMMSNRYHGMGMTHFKKCKYLYENAKVIYTDIMSTFDIVGESHGIDIIGRDKQRMPRQYDHIDVLNDGGSCTRIINTIKDILDEDKPLLI